MNYKISESYSAKFPKFVRMKNFNTYQKNDNKKSHQYWLMALMFTDKEAYLPLFSSETVNFFLPRARLRATTALPLTDAILCLKPCLFVRLRLLGWYVLFMLPSLFGTAKLQEKLIPAIFGSK